MTKRKRITIIIVSLVVVALGVVVCGILTRNKNKEEAWKASFRSIYLRVSDNQGNRFDLGKDRTMHEKNLEYEYADDVLKFDAEAFYANGTPCLEQTFISFRQITIQLSEPGLYHVDQIYKDPDGGLDLSFRLNVTVKKEPDTRPVPVIEILPDENCVSYEMNKRYVYKYDGEWHLPKYFKAYEPSAYEHGFKSLIATLSVDGYAGNVEKVEGPDTNQDLIDIGVYKFELYVNAPNVGIGGEDGNFAPTKIFNIIVEIIE